MGTLYSDWMFPITDMNIKTDSKGRCCKQKLFAIYLDV